MQAWSYEKAVEDRIKQAHIFRQFVDAQQIPTSFLGEPIIMAGDFNVDLISFQKEVKNLFLILDAQLPNITGTQNYTSDPLTNLLVGRDGQADPCKDSYKKVGDHFSINSIIHHLHQNKYVLEIKNVIVHVVN